MLWSEIDNDDFSVWVIPAARYKTKIDFEVPLSGAALRMLQEARRIKLGTSGYVFTTNDGTPISGFSKWKAHFDALMLAERCKIAEAYGDEVDKITVPGWTILDLRRTARSLMSQAGVAPDHAERALGHVIGGCVACIIGTPIARKSDKLSRRWLHRLITSCERSDGRF